MVAQCGRSWSRASSFSARPSDVRLAARAQFAALGLFREAEGVSLILPRASAEALGFPVALPMRRIVLTVHSALDGVGLTAAVAAALAAEEIPCNVVAAFHHDHVFVPAAMADRALTVLEALQARAAVARRASAGRSANSQTGRLFRSGPENAPVMTR